MPIRAARYRRVSGTSQEDNTSLQTQLERENEYCQRHGYTTTDDTLYTEVMSGVIWRDRSELQRMLKNAAEGKFEVVVIDHLDRIGRGDPVIIIMEELSFHNVKLECVQVKIEHTDEGRLLVYFEAYSSKKEHSRILKRTSDGRMKYLKEGKQLGGVPKYGYRWNEDHTNYEPDPIERGIIERIFAMAKQGMTVRAVARTLNEEGIPTRKNEQWQTYLITKILTDKNYVAYQFSDPKEQEVIASIRLLATQGLKDSEIRKTLNKAFLPWFPQSGGIIPLATFCMIGPILGKGAV